MIEEGLVARLIADADIAAMVVGAYNRVFPLQIPQRVQSDPDTVPCIVYARVSGTRDLTFCATDDLVSANFRVDSYAANYTDARALARLVRLRLVDFTGEMGDTHVDRVLIGAELDLLDPEPGLYRVSQTYTIWYKEE